MIGRNHKGAIMTTNDRCTHLVLIRRLAGKEATPLASTAIEALLPYKRYIRYRLTTERNSPAIRRLRRDSMPSSTSHAHATLGSGVQTKTRTD